MHLKIFTYPVKICDVFRAIFYPSFAGGGPFTGASFLPYISLNYGNSPGMILTADLDGDGKVPFPWFRPTNFTYGNIRKIISGDLDGDGKSDIVAINDSSSSVFTYINTSSGGNTSFGAQTVIPGVRDATDIGISDLNGDGKPDIAAKKIATAWVAIWVFLTTKAGFKWQSWK